MNKLLASKIVKIGIQKEVISKEYAVYYKYTIERKLQELISLVLLLIISAVTGYLGYTLPFILFYSSYRSSSGGVHARNEIECFIYFLVILILGVLFSIYLVSTKYFIVYVVVLWIFSFISAYLFAPVGTKNKVLEVDKALILRKKTFLTLMVQAIIVLIIYLVFKNNDLISILTTGTFFQSITLLPIFNKRQYLYKRSKDCTTN